MGSCWHEFCASCIENFIKFKVDEGDVLKINCPYAGCEKILTNAQLQKYLSQEYYQKYQRIKIAKLRNRDPRIKSCPKAGCSREFLIDDTRLYTICKCGSKICNICCSFWHEGKSCLEVIDLQFESYAQENEIKFCIMCKSSVTRTEGCLHIICPVCDYEWCWTCGRQYNLAHQTVCPKEWSPIPPSIRQLTPDYVKLGRFIEITFSILLVILTYSRNLGLDECTLLVGILSLIALILFPFACWWWCYGPPVWEDFIFTLTKRKGRWYRGSESEMKYKEVKRHE
jgi:IBR domain.